MDMEGIVQTNNAQNGNLCSGEINAVILHTQNQLTASELHAQTLEGRGIQSTLISCDDLSWFLEPNIDSFEEVHLIVDTSMFTNIMKDGQLDRRAQKVFRECDRSRKQIYVVDNFPEDLNELLYQLPRNARRKWEDNKDLGVQATGMTGGEARESIVVGTHHGQQTIVYGNVFNVHTGNKLEITGKEIPHGQNLRIGVQPDQLVDQNRNHLQITIKHDQNEGENDRMLTEVSVHKDQLLNDHITKINVEKGSIIITLTVEKHFIMTDEWIHDLLRIIFSDILGSFIAEGTTFFVNVERYVTLSKEEILKLYFGQQNQNQTKAFSLEDCEEKEKQSSEDASTQTETVFGFTNKQSKNISTQTENMDASIRKKELELNKKRLFEHIRLQQDFERFKGSENEYKDDTPSYIKLEDTGYSSFESRRCLPTVDVKDTYLEPFEPISTPVMRRERDFRKSIRQFIDKHFFKSRTAAPPKRPLCELEELKYKYDAYIMYAEDDLISIMDQLCLLESKHGLRLWIGGRDQMTGTLIYEGIISALEQSRTFVAILSPGFLESSWSLEEYNMASYMAVERKSKLILVKHNDISTDIPSLVWRLRRKDFLYWNKPNPTSFVRDLAKAIKDQLGKSC